MKFGTRGRYAVTALADLADCGVCGPVCLSGIAERQKISLSYLEQLFVRLRRAGLVKSVRGPGGGYLLAIEPEEVVIAAIIDAVGETIGAECCEADGSAAGCRDDQSHCLGHELWRELARHTRAYLASVTLADVIHHRLPAQPGHGEAAVMVAAAE